MLLMVMLMKHGNMMNLLWMTSGNQTQMGTREELSMTTFLRNKQTKTFMWLRDTVNTFCCCFQGRDGAAALCVSLFWSGK